MMVFGVMGNVTADSAQRLSEEERLSRRHDRGRSPPTFLKLDAIRAAGLT